MSKKPENIYYGPSVIEMAEIRLKEINKQIAFLQKEKKQVLKRIEKYSKPKEK